MNSFQFVDWITMESLRHLLNKLEVSTFFNTDYNKEFTREYAVGETVRVKLPQRFLIREGLGYSPQPINRLNTTVAVDQIFGVDFEWDSAEAALKLERGKEQIRKEYLVPAMNQIAQEIDSRAAKWAYQNTPNIVGVLGTNPTTFKATSGAARTRLIQLAGWEATQERGMIVDPSITENLVDAGKAQFNPTSEISRQYKEGSLGRQGGFDWYESMSLYRHTAGVWQTPASVTVKGSGQSGSSILVNATTGDTFKKGDVINFADVRAVNPSTRRDAGHLKEFVILADVTAANSEATLSISPAIYGPGSQYQNVDALPLDTAVLTLFPGTTTPSTGPKSGIQSLALVPDAFALVGVKLEVPKAAELASQMRDPNTGIAVRFVRMFDPQQSKMINRFDVCLGFGNLYNDQCAVRVLGA